jgi:hypothetical protein
MQTPSRQQPQFDELVPDSQVRTELGGLSAMTTWRWDSDKDPSKPPAGWEPAIRIGNRKFRRRSMVETVKANLLRAAIEQRGA